MRSFLLTITVLFPWFVRRRLYTHMLKWRIHRTARIGLSYVNVGMLEMGPNTSIGHFNVLRDIASATFGPGSMVGQWNWITAAAVIPDTPREIEIGRESAITSRHYIDTTGGVYIGAFTTLAGVRSTILTHQIDVERNEQSFAPVRVGQYCLVSSNACLVPGSEIPDRSVVGMGAVVVGQLATVGGLYVGVPARLAKELEANGRYFSRERAAVNYAHPGEPTSDANAN